MPARVYECKKEELPKLKQLLSYDPYLDPGVIPPLPSFADKPADRLTEDEKRTLAERENRVKEAIARLRSEKFADVIFARQEYEILDGALIGKPDVSYLYLKGSGDFLKNADGALEFKLQIKRAGAAIEQKIIEKVEKEKEGSNMGFGSIFG